MSSSDRTGAVGVGHPMSSDSLGVAHVVTPGSVIRPWTPRLAGIERGCKDLSSIGRSHRGLSTF